MDTNATLTVGKDAYLAGAADAVLEALKKQLTVENPKYRDARKYGRWIGKKLKPYILFYEQDAVGIRFPRGYANHAVFLCRKHMRQTPAIFDRRRERPPIALSFHGELRPYQQKAVAAMTRHDFGVLESGTGSGKTVIALAVIAARKQPALILVHTKELLYQWAERVKSFLDVEPGMIGDGHCIIAPVTIAIVNSARSRLADLPQRFGHLCVDECHRVPATLFTDVVTAFDCRYSLGLSATAFRRDGLTKLIYLYLGDRTHVVDQEELQLSGAVLKPEFIQRPTSFSYKYRGNYQDLLQALTADQGRNTLIAEDIVNECRSGSGTILVVSDRVAHCERLAALLNDKQLRIAVLTGKLPAEERAAQVEAIHRGDIDVLISTMQLIGEGFDCPGLQTLFLTTPIKFSGRLLQVVGRILRPAAGKQPKVYDYVDPVGVLKSSAQARRMTYQSE